MCPPNETYQPSGRRMDGKRARDEDLMRCQAKRLLGRPRWR